MVLLRPLIIALLLSSCGGPEFDVLVRSETATEINYLCPSGEFVQFPDALPPDERRSWPGLAEAEGCLGIADSCPAEGGRPGEANCQSATYNRFAGTCVEAFFDCYKPTGACNLASDDALNWSSGHARSGQTSSNQQFFAPGSDAPCVISSNDSGSRRLFLKERP